jgi:hypothetical protein
MSSEKIEKYGALWPADTLPLKIELACIERGGKWTGRNGPCGLGLEEHFMRARELIWPGRYRHRWTDMIYHEIITNIVTILMGCGSSQKTSHASEYCLIDYWANPQKTLVLVSTVTVDKLDTAVFGEIKMLFNDARELHPWLSGIPIESKRAITTDDRDKNEARDIRKGIIGRACYVGRQYVGLGVYAGIKQARIRFLADELQFMAPTFFDCLPNMFQSVDLDDSGDPQIKVIGSGNPKHDPFDQLSIAAEPVLGWASVADRTKSSTWSTKFHRGVCLNLIGTDSPNFDVAEGEKPPFPRLISRNTAKLVETRWGKDSLQYYTQCVGKMMMNMIGKRVVTMEFCQEHQAFAKALWRGTPTTKIGFLDPAWGGVRADRCVWGWLEFGTAQDGGEIIRFGEYQVVPIIANLGIQPDDQIAQFCKRQASLNGIDPTDIFYDSTGRGTIGAAFARVFGDLVPVPVAFGDRPSPRPVRYDLFVEEDGYQRLKRCDEEYGKFVTELWFAARMVIECDQMRELPEEVAKEGCCREYMTTKGNKIDVESKDDTIERMGVSPDLFDAYVVGIEGARQRGFKTKRIGEDVIIERRKGTGGEDWLDSESKAYDKAIKDRLLAHGVYEKVGLRIR